MSGIIGVLERLGRREARHVTAALTTGSTDLDAAEHEALVTGNRALLVEMSGARASMACLVVAPEDQPAPDEEQPGEPVEPPVDHPDDARPQAA